MTDDVEVIVGDDTITVTIPTDNLVVTLDIDDDFEILQADDDDIEVTLQSVSSTALTIGLYARMMIWVRGNPDANELLIRYEFTDNVVFAASLASSLGSSGTMAAAISAFSFEKNGVEFGTATFAAASSVAVFAGAGASFVAGDILTVYAPAVQDITLADVSLTLAGSRVV